MGEAEPPGIRATDTEGGFFWIYAPVRFEDHAMVTIIQERPERRADHAGRPPGLPHRLRPGARMARSTRAPAALRPGSRTVDRGHLSYFGPHGQKTAEVEVETLLAFPLLLGSGYGLEPDWKHGMYQGELVVQGQTIPPARSELLSMGAHRVRSPVHLRRRTSATECSNAR